MFEYQIKMGILVGRKSYDMMYVFSLNTFQQGTTALECVD